MINTTVPGTGDGQHALPVQLCSASSQMGETQGLTTSSLNSQDRWALPAARSSVATRIFLTVFFLQDEKGLAECWKAGIFGIRRKKNRCERKEATVTHPFHQAALTLTEGCAMMTLCAKFKLLFINRHGFKT